jgi:hypothetical protein
VSAVQEEEGPSFFEQLVAQEADFCVAEADWSDDHEENEAVLQEFSTLALHFAIARLARFSKIGEPKGIRFKVEVEVVGPVTKTRSGLILPSDGEVVKVAEIPRAEDGNLPRPTRPDPGLPEKKNTLPPPPRPRTGE